MCIFDMMSPDRPLTYLTTNIQLLAFGIKVWSLKDSNYSRLVIML